MNMYMINSSMYMNIPYSIKLMCSQASTTIAFPLTISLLLLILYTLWNNKKTNSNKNLPPSPPKLPIIGNIHQLSIYRPHLSLRSLSDRYGELMLIYIGNLPSLIVSSARAAREIMITHDLIFANRVETKRAKKLLYDSKDVMAASYGEQWRQRRSIIVQHVLNNNTVRCFRSVRVEETAVVVDNIQLAVEESSAVNLTEMFANFTIDVISRLSWGRKYNKVEDSINIHELVNEFLVLFGELNASEFIPWLTWVDRLSGWDSKADKVAENFDRFLEKLIKEHQHHDHSIVDDGKDPKRSTDFLDALLKIYKDPNGIPIDRDTVKALVLDMILAGTDTTAVVAEWTMAELLRHPKIMENVQKEVRDIIGENLEVNENDLQQMKYLKAVMKETLRLHPPIPMLSIRSPSQDIKVLGYDIPAGAAVAINCYAIQRDPANWHEPETFNPDRFLNSSTDFRGQDFEFIPFGAGRRICAGYSLGMANTELLVANLLLEFDWRLPAGITPQTMDMSERTGITVPMNAPLIAIPITRAF